MDKVVNCLFAAITLLLSARGEVFKGNKDFLHMFTRPEQMRSPVLWFIREAKWRAKALKVSLPTILSDSSLEIVRI